MTDRQAAELALAEALRPLFDGPESVHLERLGWWDGDLLALTRLDIARRALDAILADPEARRALHAATGVETFADCPPDCRGHEGGTDR